MNEKIWRKQFLFAKPKILTLWCLAYCGVEFFELCDQIARQIETEFENALACLPGAQMCSKLEKMEVENVVTHSL